MSYADFISATPLRHAWFVLFDFKSGQYRLWNGFRVIDIGGNEWLPVGTRATISQIEDAVSDQIPSITMKVSGVDTGVLAEALGSSDEVQGRLAFVYDCFFDEKWQPLTTLEAYGLFRMDTMKITRSQGTSSDGAYEQVIELTCESFLTQGPYPPFGRYTSADQAQRFPGVTDNYFQFVPGLMNKVLRWPTF